MEQEIYEAPCSNRGPDDVDDVFDEDEYATQADGVKEAEEKERDENRPRTKLDAIIEWLPAWLEW